MTDSTHIEIFPDLRLIYLPCTTLSSSSASSATCTPSRMRKSKSTLGTLATLIAHAGIRGVVSGSFPGSLERKGFDVRLGRFDKTGRTDIEDAGRAASRSFRLEWLDS